MYNYQVAREFLKQIYVAERLQPPSLSTVQSVYKSLWANATSPAYIRELVSSGAYLKVGVYAVEAYGIFKVSIQLSLNYTAYRILLEYIVTPHPSSHIR